MKSRVYFFNGFPHWRHYADYHKCSTIDYHVSVHQNLVLAVMPPNHLYFDAEFTAHAGRHPGGMQSVNSECAITNRDSSHS